jgi:hypothetical protein
MREEVPFELQLIGCLIYIDIRMLCFLSPIISHTIKVNLIRLYMEHTHVLNVLVMSFWHERSWQDEEVF